MKWTRGSLQGIPLPASSPIAGRTTGSGANETGTIGRRRRQRPVRTGPRRLRLQQTEIRPVKGCRVVPPSPAAAEPAGLQSTGTVPSDRKQCRTAPSKPNADAFGAHTATIPSSEFTVTTDPNGTTRSAAGIAGEENRVGTGTDAISTD